MENSLCHFKVQKGRLPVKASQGLEAGRHGRIESISSKGQARARDNTIGICGWDRAGPKADAPGISWSAFRSNRIKLLFRPGEAVVEVPSGADESDVGEGLREVAEVLAGGAELFGIKAEVVGIAEGFLEDEAGLFQVASASEAFDIPEGAGGKGAFAAVHAVGRGFGGVVPVDEGIFDEALFDDVQGGFPTRVGGADEFDHGQEE